MATTVQTTTDQTPSVLPAAEARSLFDRQARRLLSLSGEEFLARWDAGAYRDLRDTPEGRQVGYLALLIPFGRKYSPEDAVDAFIGPLRRTLACVVRGTAIASGAEQDEDNAVTLFPEGQDGGDPARLLTHGGEGEILFRFAHQYRVVHVPGDRDRGPYKVSSSFYRYDVLDRDGGEVVVFHWEPEGRSTVRSPHLHLPAAAPIVLPQRTTSGIAASKTHLNKLHLPTGGILVEDVVELLIREFAAVPLVEDWEATLSENRAAFLRGRTR